MNFAHFTILALSLLFNQPLPTETSFIIKIIDSYPMLRFRYEYNLTPSDLVINLHFDDSRPSKIIFRLKLSVSQKKRLSSFLSSFPVEKLENQYVDPSIDDGSQIEFFIKSGSKPARKIRMENVCQPELSKLCGEINKLTPDEIKLAPWCVNQSVRENQSSS